MRMIITQKDISSLTGKFIIEINDEEEDTFELNDKNWNFYKEKRISFISGLQWCGFYYTHNSYKLTAEEFVEDFNPKNGRFRRLLTSKEMDFMFEKLKEEIY